MQALDEASLKLRYPWLPKPGDRFPHDLDQVQAEGLLKLVREVTQEPYSDQTNDLIMIAFRKGKQHARFALDAVTAEREGQSVEREVAIMARESRRDRILEHFQWAILVVGVVAALAAIAQALSGH